MYVSNQARKRLSSIVCVKYVTQIWFMKSISYITIHVPRYIKHGPFLPPLQADEQASERIGAGKTIGG